MKALPTGMSSQGTTEEALKSSEQRYRSLFDSIDEGFCVIEMIFDDNNKPVDYRFLEINPSFEKNTGLVNAEGKRMREFAPNHEEFWFETYGKIALTGEPARFQNRAEQLRRWYDVYAFRFGEPKNRQVAILFKDISEQKVAEEKIAQLNASLHQKAIELQASNKELEAFSYSVSHDLRAPLRSIDGFSKALLEDYDHLLDETGRDYLRRVRSASTRMASLIDDMLNLSRVTLAELHRESVDLSKTVREVAIQFQQSQPDRHVEFNIAEGLSDYCDPRLIRICLENLMANAWKYSGKNPAARIEFGMTSQEGKSAYFIRDNGVGFDMAYSGQLFGAFQRLHSMEEFEGTGVGLATVDRIIRRHGGRVWAVGKVNEGATFYFSL